VGLFVVGLDELGFDVGLGVGSLVGFLVGATGFVVGVRLVGLVVVDLVVGVLLVGFFDVGFGVVGFAVGTTVGLANGSVVGRGECGTFGLRGIVLVNVRLPSSINCTSPVKRRYQSEGNEVPSASKANQPFDGCGLSIVLDVTLKMAVLSSTSSN